jgi:hypothetical protein
MYYNKKKHPDALRENKILNQMSDEVPGFGTFRSIWENCFDFEAEAKVPLITIRGMLQYLSLFW